jgi:hypothetical protein
MEIRGSVNLDTSLGMHPTALSSCSEEIVALRPKGFLVVGYAIVGMALRRIFLAILRLCERTLV